jgi:hypothetical protein
MTNKELSSKDPPSIIVTHFLQNAELIKPGLSDSSLFVPITQRFGFGIRIRIQEDKNEPQKYKFFLEISCFKVLDVFF